MRKKIIPITDSETKSHLLLKFCRPISIEDFHHLTRKQYSHNSALSMVKDWNDYIEFCSLKKVTALPTSVTALRLYIQKVKQTKKYSTIKRNVVSISVIHRFLEFQDPSSHQQIQLEIRSLRIAKPSSPQSAVALTQSHIDTLRNRWDVSETKMLRDLLIIELMFECALKRSHLCDMLCTDINHILRPVESYVVTISGENYQLSDETSRHLKRWTSILGTETGPLFRSIDRHGNIGFNPLDVSSVYRVFRAASDTLDLPEHLTGQSPRAGAARQLASQGLSLKDIQHFGRWLSPAMPAHYIGNHHVADNERLKFKTLKPWLK
jgi:integrase